MGFRPPSLLALARALRRRLAPPELVIIEEKDGFASVIRGKTFSKTAAVVCRAKSGNLTADLTALKDDCVAKGFADAWSGAAKICLSAASALFLDFRLPPASRRKAKKMMPLLLDGELPLAADGYAAETVFARDGALFATTIVVPRETLAAWRDACEAVGLTRAEVCVFPWPIIAALPPLSDPALLVCPAEDGVVLCALTASGEVSRARQLPPGENPGALARLARLAVADADFTPRTILIFGDGRFPGLKDALAAEFALPALSVGEDLPVGGEFPDENNPARVVALSLDAPARCENPSFPLRLARAPRRFPWLVPTSVCLLALFCVEALWLFDAIGDRKRAENLRALSSEELRSALGDAPKNAGVGRLIAILNSRLQDVETAAPEADSPAAFLENLHKLCPQDARIELRRFAWDGKRVSLAGGAGGYDEVETFKKIAEQVPGAKSVRILNAATAPGGAGRKASVDFELDWTREER